VTPYQSGATIGRIDFRFMALVGKEKGGGVLGRIFNGLFFVVG
jgi:hypothetical protein